MIETRYQALRTISAIYKLAAVLIGIAAVLAALGVIITGANSASYSNSFGYGGAGAIGSLLAGALVLVGGLLTAIFVYAFANILDLLLSMEENTRLTALLLQQQTRGTANAGARPPAASGSADDPLR
ncbi:MAG TPA: hypothetical protein VMT34_03325 [Aggregatilineales bacterium]|nr:hypothetical protein [Aggregatilineales bacterium]